MATNLVTLNKFIQRNTTSQIIELVLGGVAIAIPFGAITVKYFYRGKAGVFVTLAPVANVGGVDVWETNAWRVVNHATLNGVYQYGIPNALLNSTEKELMLKFEINAFYGVEDILYQINLTDIDNVNLGKDALLNPIIVNEANLVNCNMLRSLQLLMASLAGNTVGAGTPIIEFKKAGAEQTDLTATIIKATMDNNGDRSEIEFP